MIIDIGICALGILVGILAGLLPGLPAWLAPFLLLPFVHIMSGSQIIIFWMISVIGSQFFGSMSSIMFGVPGENSTLVYIDQVRNLSSDLKQKLIRYTADASVIATVVSIVIAYWLIKTIITDIPFLSTTKFTLFVLWWSALVIVLMNPRHLLMSFLLFVVGVVLSGSDSIALPAWVIQLNSLTYDVSVVNLIVGTLLLPSAFVTHSHTSIPAEKTSQTNFFASTISGTLIGIVSGFLPGPTATVSSTLSWNIHRKQSLFNRVISVEAANNSVVIVGALVFMALQTPLALDAVTVNEAITRQGWSQNLMSLLTIKYCIIVLVSTIILWILARSCIPMYSTVCKLLDSKVVIIGLSSILIIADFYSAQGSYNTILYFLWMTLFTIIGIILAKRSMAVTPLLLGFVLGESLIWTTYQIILS